MKPKKPMTLISIIGDFHSSILPISYAFREQIRSHIIVYDDAKCDVANAKRIVRGQREFLDSYHGVDYSVLEYKIDEDSYESILACLAFATKSAERVEDVYLNSTDVRKEKRGHKEKEKRKRGQVMLMLLSCCVTTITL